MATFDGESVDPGQGWCDDDPVTESEWMSAPPAAALTGAEAFSGVDATVQDFWRFALSDLRMNNVRGISLSSW